MTTTEAPAGALADRVPQEINDLLDEQTPGRVSASFRHSVRQAIVQVLQWEGGQLAVPCTGEHQVSVVKEASRLLSEYMKARAP